MHTSARSYNFFFILLTNFHDILDFKANSEQTGKLYRGHNLTHFFVVLSLKRVTNFPEMSSFTVKKSMRQLEPKALYR
jgi:hypothetical protein